MCAWRGGKGEGRGEGAPDTPLRARRRRRRRQQRRRRRRPRNTRWITPKLQVGSLSPPPRLWFFFFFAHITLSPPRIFRIERSSREERTTPSPPAIFVLASPSLPSPLRLQCVTHNHSVSFDPRWSKEREYTRDYIICIFILYFYFGSF